MKQDPSYQDEDDNANDQETRKILEGIYA